MLAGLDLNTELIFAARLLVAALLGAAIGLERERHGQDAGVGTFSLVAIGAAIFAILSDVMATTPSADNSRVAAAVATGIGFLGAGVILRTKRRIVGLTTAAALWAVAAIGLAVGNGRYILSVVATAICLVILAIRHVPPIERRLDSLDE